MPESASQVTKTNRLHIYPLTSLRFFAAFLIFVLHASNHNFFPSSYLHHFDLSKSVCFFFVLSGFVLSYAYDNTHICLRTFYRARLLRIWPLTVASLVFVFLFLPSSLYLPLESSIFSSAAVLTTHIFCIQAFFPISSFYFGFNAVSWSISAELFFYALFPFVIRLKTSKLLLCTISYTLFLLFFASYLNRFELEFFSSSNYDFIDINGLLYINPLARLPEFLIGVLAFKVFSSPYYNKFFAQYARLKLRIKLFYYLLDVLIMFLLLSFAFGRSLSFTTRLELLDFSILQLNAAIFFAIIILMCISSFGLISKILSLRLFVSLGNLSFSFYLLHQPIMIRASQVGSINIGGFPLFHSSFLSVLFYSLLISLLFHYFIEKRLIALIRS
tara:strand:- start:329 stop:1489 length:1161 start_codon:yes stop_codon:yes gene_type:complete